MRMRITSKYYEIVFVFSPTNIKPTPSRYYIKQFHLIVIPAKQDTGISAYLDKSGGQVPKDGNYEEAKPVSRQLITLRIS